MAKALSKSTEKIASVIYALLDEYQISAYSLAQSISLSPSTLRGIFIGKNGLSVPVALRLAKFFGKSPEFWLDLQREADLKEAAKDKELTAILKGITKVKKPVSLKRTTQVKKPVSSKKTAQVKKPVLRKSKLKRRRTKRV